MSRATHLLHWVLAGCVASCFLSWLAAQMPQSLTSIVSVNALVLFLWGMCWILDDGLIKITRLEALNYYTILILAGVAHFTGLVLYLWMYHAI